MDPQLLLRTEEGLDLPYLVWRFPAPCRVVSSAILGGGLGTRRWILNAQVKAGYGRLDPAEHLTELATAVDLAGPGVGLLTAVDVAEVVAESDDGIRLWATVGLGAPIQAYDPAAGLTETSTAARPGTVNVVAWAPRLLGDAALVNAVATITEAKTQAIRDLGLAATGTATDAVCVLCPTDGAPAAYGGPRSRWGEPLARAAYRAVLAGGRSWAERSGG